MHSSMPSAVVVVSPPGATHHWAAPAQLLVVNKQASAATALPAVCLRQRSRARDGLHDAAQPPARLGGGLAPLTPACAAAIARPLGLQSVSRASLGLIANPFVPTHRVVFERLQTDPTLRAPRVVQDDAMGQIYFARLDDETDEVKWTFDIKSAALEGVSPVLEVRRDLYIGIVQQSVARPMQQAAEAGFSVQISGSETGVRIVLSGPSATAAIVLDTVLHALKTTVVSTDLFRAQQDQLMNFYDTASNIAPHAGWDARITTAQRQACLRALRGKDVSDWGRRFCDEIYVLGDVRGNMTATMVAATLDCLWGHLTAAPYEQGRRNYRDSTRVSRHVADCDMRL